MNKIKKNFCLNLIYQILAMIAPLILTPFLSRKLGSEGIGEYSYYYACVSYFGLFSILGNTLYGNRSIAEVSHDKEKRTLVFYEIYLWQFVSSIITVIGYIIYVSLFHRQSKTAWIFTIYIFSFIFEISWFYFGMEEFKMTIFRNLLIKVITIISTLFLIRKISDVWLYALIISVSALLANGVLFLSLPKYIDKVKLEHLHFRYSHICSSLIFFIPVISVSIYKIMDKIMLGSLTEMKEVGFYENCEKIVSVPMLVVTALGTVMLPRVSNMLGQGRGDESLIYLENSFQWIMKIVCAMCFGIMAIADLFVPLFFGQGFDKCADLLFILEYSCIFLAFAQVLKTQYLIPHKLEKHFNISVGLGAVANVIFNSLLIPQYGSIGAAIGSVIAEFVVCAYQCWVVRKDIPVRKYIVRCLPYCLIGILMYISVRNIRNYFSFGKIGYMLFKVSWGAVVYISLCLVYQLVLKYRHE